MENTNIDIEKKIMISCKKKKRNAPRAQTHQGREDDPEKKGRPQNPNHQDRRQNQHCQNITEIIIMLICL